MVNLRKFLAVICAGALLLPPQGMAFAADSSSDLNIVLGDVESIPVNNLSRVSVTSPEVADISDAQTDKVMVLAKKAGQTAVFLWDDDGKHTVIVHVTNQDLGVLKERIAHMLAEAGINGLNLEANAAEGKVVVSGEVPKEKRNILDKSLEPYADQVINLTKDQGSEDLIQIDMQITELSSTLDKNLGFDWQALKSDGSGGSLALNYAETGLPTTGSKDWFKFGQFNRTTAILNTLNLLISEGKARDLSRPRILVTSGKEATINVGGEVPIQTTTTNATGGSVQSNVTFKQYGVTLTVTPTIKEGNKIDVVMNLQVSDVDSTFPIKASTTSDIAYKTRSAQTQLMLDDRQTVVFAGLIRYTDSQQTKSVPFLGKLPIVGLLFRNTSKQTPDQGKELVVTLTPTILRKKEYGADQVKLPSQAMKDFEKEVDRTEGYEREPVPGGPVPSAPALSSAAVPGSSASSSLTTTSASSVTTTVINSSDTISPYVRSIQMKISHAIVYPAQALQNKMQGTVKLRLRILRDGSLADAVVAESSGQNIFDDGALATAKAVAPYGPFTSDIQGDSLTIMLPIVYTQQGVIPKPDTQTAVAAY